MGQGGSVRSSRSRSIGYQGEHRSYRNELDWAAKMAAHVGADHHELKLDVEDLIDFLPAMARAQDEPIADPVCVPVYYVSKLARDHGVVVAQVGEGADELFAGYPSWHRSLALQRWMDRTGPGWAKRPALWLAEAAGKHRGFRYEHVRRAAAGQPVFWGGAEAFTQLQQRALLAPDLRRELEGLTSWQALAPIRADFRGADLVAGGGAGPGARRDHRPPQAGLRRPGGRVPDRAAGRRGVGGHDLCRWGGRVWCRWLGVACDAQ